MVTHAILLVTHKQHRPSNAKTMLILHNKLKKLTYWGDDHADERFTCYCALVLLHALKRDRIPNKTIVEKLLRCMANQRDLLTTTSSYKLVQLVETRELCFLVSFRPGNMSTLISVDNCSSRC